MLQNNRQMSALGHLRPSVSGPVRINVRYWSDSVLDFAAQRMQRCATTGLMHRSKQRLYLFRSLARTAGAANLLPFCSELG
jgi:hypothetical protein